MAYQIVLIAHVEEGPVRTSSMRLPNAYETLACARKMANHMLDNYWADAAQVVVWGTNDLSHPPGTFSDRWAELTDDMPF